jgi:hypothetical protein
MESILHFSTMTHDKFIDVDTTCLFLSTHHFSASSTSYRIESIRPPLKRFYYGWLLCSSRFSGHHPSCEYTSWVNQMMTSITEWKCTWITCLPSSSSSDSSVSQGTPPVSPQELWSDSMWIRKHKEECICVPLSQPFRQPHDMSSTHDYQTAFP